MKIIFETERLRLRQFSTADAGLVLQLNSDPAVTKFLHERLLTDEADAANVIEKIILPQYEKGLGRWAVFVKEDDQFIGWCGLKYRADIDETDIGYRFIPSSWGKGYATEAARATLKYGFEHLKLGTITGCAHIENTASLKILETIG
ncbi:MAG: N-acetyltransferase, partial [Pedobacter sp.]